MKIFHKRAFTIFSILETIALVIGIIFAITDHFTTASIFYIVSSLAALLTVACLQHRNSQKKFSDRFEVVVLLIASFCMLVSCSVLFIIGTTESYFYMISSILISIMIVFEPVLAGFGMLK